MAILTPIPPEQLPAVLERFRRALCDPCARAVFDRIAATSSERARSTRTESDRQTALALARRLGMGVATGAPETGFSWDGARVSAGTEAYVLLHEIAHYQLAPPERRRTIDFGLGPGPDTGDRAAAERATVVTGIEREREEARASLLGILWEVALGQPALASFLDQNWLEGAGTAAARHFTTVLETLRADRLVDGRGVPVPRV